MKELNNLMESDKEIFAKYGEVIKEFKSLNETALLSYIKGLIMMSMNDLNYSDTDISFICDEVGDRLLNDDEPAKAIEFEWSHVIARYR